ncbi:ABC transporter substrate-binding protein [Herbiconiux sp.]|uniref:ABC transporter substrate-binding protein n=1 Tax=Herbiconiux sp. TaxID=1871186 RepID=UPI0025BF6264|nr:ABC transporter substrate-binding protein [Herbiconiux sp.]
MTTPFAPGPPRPASAAADRFAVPRGVIAGALGIASLLVLSGCFAGGSDAANDSAAPAPIATMAQPMPSGDGTLVIGAVVPLTGAEGSFGAAELAGVQLAARDIGEAGGFGGGSVLVLHADAGDTSTTQTADGVAALIGRGADALVGPSRPGLQAPFADAAVAAGLPGLSAVGEPVAVDESFAARLRSADPTLSDTRFGAESYDAAVMIALAATMAGDDGPASIAQFLPAVTSGSVACSSYGACLDALGAQTGIRYSGVSGTLGIAQVTGR